jgi:hypothetical protein
MYTQRLAKSPPSDSSPPSSSFGPEASFTKWSNAIIDTNHRTCPYCRNFSVLRYQNMDHTLQSPPEMPPSEIQALLMERFGNTPALHMHLYENHRKEIIDVLAKEQDLRREHRQRVDSRDSYIRIIRFNNDAELHRFQTKHRVHAKTELQRVLAELIAEEQRHPFLREERKKYESEIQADPYKKFGL